VSTAAILANPASGSDIRRLVAHGSVFDNHEKVRMVRRIIFGLEKAGVKRVLYMPDGYGIVPRATDAIETSVEVTPLDMRIRNDQDDTTRAAVRARDRGAKCLMVLGGDGTSRAACKGCLDVPLLSLSTGTNNVFPVMAEATIAGLAAGITASGRFSREATCIRSCMLEILRDGEPVDLALVDAAVYSDLFAASRAVWHMEKVSHLFLTRCRPDAIGLSSVGGRLTTIAPEEPRGLALEFSAEAEASVTAPIAPGLFADVGVKRTWDLAPGQVHTVDIAPCIIALDGEREVDIRRGSKAGVRLTTQGPWVVDMRKVMTLAQQAGLFTSQHQATGA